MQSERKVGYLSSLISANTPKSRSEKSSFLQRSSQKRAIKNDRSISSDASFDTSLPIARKQLYYSGEGMSAYNSLLGFDDNGTAFSSFKSLDMEETTSNDVIMLEEDPSVQVGNLFQEFRDLYHSCSGEPEVFDLIFQFEEVCSSASNVLLNVIHKSAPNHSKVRNMKEVFSMLQEEKSTWRIIRTLYHDRLRNELISDDDEMLMDITKKRVSDKQLIDNLFLRNSYIRQCQLVVDWLELNAADVYEYQYFDKLEFFSDHSVAWEHTLHDLTNPIVVEKPSRKFLVTELDPDAPIRQRTHALNDDDKVDEERLVKYMFLYLRSGNLEKAQDLAVKFGHIWLAASLEGWRPFHDPNYDNNGNELLPVEGNKYRDVWKASCWRMAAESKISKYQLAIYGTLSGNLKSILPVCYSWEDYLWAYARCYVDKQIEFELRKHTQAKRVLDELPTEYWDKQLDVEQIFLELQTCHAEGVRKECQNYYHVIQKFIILDDVDSLIETMYQWSRQKPAVMSHLLRMMAHIVLFLTTIKRCTKRELCVAILEAYVNDLINQHKIPLVAFYVATLPDHHQIEWYAKFLEGITDTSERQLCLQYAEEVGLNLPQITKAVVQLVREQVSDVADVSGLSSKMTTEEDQRKINAIDWLVFDQSQRAEAMKQANALMRLFIVQEKLDSAKKVFAKIPPDSVEVITSISTMKGHNNLLAEDDNAIREYFCFQTYLDAHEAFNDWFHHFQNERPKRPEPVSSSNLKFKDKVAHEHRMKDYELELERWHNSTIAQTKDTTDRLYNVLLFLNGGWMTDQRKDCTIDDSRQQQLSLLRKLCIPQIVSLLHKVLHSTEQYKESVQLADIIAAENHGLYKEFSVHQLQDLLSALRESSLALLGQNLDSFGYPIN